MKQATPPLGAQTGGIEGIQWYLTEVGGSPLSPMADFAPRNIPASAPSVSILINDGVVEGLSTIHESSETAPTVTTSSFGT
jgi:hypothetical protein